MTDLEDLLDEDDIDALTSKYLIFGLSERHYGLEIRYITEIIGLQAFTEVPDMPSFVKGVINLRGKVIPVVDVRLRFGMASVEYNDRTCIIIISINQELFGLIVDAVKEVVVIPQDKCEDPPRFGEVEGARFVRAIGKTGEGVSMLLNVENLVKI